ncbi:MFS transporter [Thermomonospora umbrina]|uniref:EmrB/QacA subfamily drug resistance transporter n=1 Tax=Thermomonospora umbrina TaxID=111806 RepID=A0A3D9SLU9_9ACTN|nr:MFS transporter [Thermomonospora umbrina]REE96902.1 EmrB/QacA subfamily drug resistance transporter [Thermomonospora umbrina]
MRKWGPLAAVCIGAFMLLVDVTIVTVALPDMATGLETSFSSLQWVMDVYALVLAALLLGSGSLADLIGRRRVYVLGLVVFAVASLACGLAPNAGTLIAARGVQGLGAAAMFATTMALINSVYRGRDRGVAFGIWGAVNGAAAAAGPIIGGLLVSPFGWRAVFLVNLPVSVLAIVLALRAVPESSDPHARRVDVPGTVTFTAGAAGLTYGLIRAGELGWTAASVVWPLAAGAVALVLFVVVEIRRPDPMLDLRLFRSSSFAALMVASALMTFAAFAYSPFLSLWLQSVLELSAIQAGLVFLPLSAVAFVVAGAGGRLVHEASPRPVIGIGLLLIGAGMAGQAVLTEDSGWAAILVGLAVVGVGVGLATPVVSSAAMAAVPVERSGMAAGAANSFRQLGFALGVAVLGGVFRDGMTRSLDGETPDPDAVAHALTGGRAQAVIAQDPGAAPLVRGAFADGLNVTMLVAGVAGVVAGLIVLAFVRRTAPAPAPAVPARTS